MDSIKKYMLYSTKKTHHVKYFLTKRVKQLNTKDMRFKPNLDRD